MKYLLSFIAGVVLSGIIVMTVMRHQACRDSDASATGELLFVKAAVEKRLQGDSRQLVTRLSAFAHEVAADQQFSLRLFVENNASAPEVTGKAAQFMEPMGFSLLDITDSAYTVLSSGHFPASRGNSIGDKGAKLSTDPVVIEDDVIGQKMVTLQTKVAFTIADSIHFFAIGGVVVDEQFLDELSPGERVRVLLKNGASIAGMTDVRTISDVKDNAVVINDKKYPAFQLPLPAAGFTEPPALIVVLITSGK